MSGGIRSVDDPPRYPTKLGGADPVKLLAIGWAVRWFGLSAYAPFVLVYLHSVLGLPYALAGTVVALPNITGLVFPMLGGGLADRFGRRRMIILTFGLETLGLAVIGVGALLAQLGLLLGGLVCSRSFGTLGAPAVSAYVTDFTDQRRRAEGQAWMRTSLNLGFTLGTLTGGALLSVATFADLAFLTALITGVSTILSRILLPPTDYDLKIPHTGKLGDSRIGGVARTTGPRPGLSSSVRALLEDRLLLVLWAAACATWTLNQQIAYGIPAFVHTGLGASYFLVGAILALNAILVVLLQVPLTRMLAGRRMTTAGIFGAGAYAVGFLGLGLEGLIRIQLVPGLVFLTGLITLGECLVFYPTSTLSMNLAPESRRGAYAGAMNMSAGVGTILAPLLSGVALGIVGNPVIAWAFLALPAVPAVFLLRAVGTEVDADLDTC